ncbi:zinc finger protein 236-like [Bradysia coprophila]|uniref:zinc finger protein 236-like n=1 Tax=Bradysia coprophila TaxID=38358 RepID=UPI00187DAAAE|nr:zinc finger protein 236-like [Bradysia coprophila]
MEFVTEFDLTNQQIVLLNDIDIVSGHEHSPTDFINCPVGDLGLEQIQYPECNSDEPNNHPSNGDGHQQHQFQIIKQRNGNRYMKFKKSKKNVKTKLVDQQPQQCPVVPCRAVFTSKLKLRKHVQEHAFKKQHRCDTCLEEFNVLENLMLHTSLHSNDGRCPQCGKVFRRLASLEGHIKTHFKSEYYTCTQGCDEMFPLEWMLKQHMNQFHPTESSKGQQEKEELAKQRKLKRRNLLSCQYCGKQFTKNCLLIRHERIHNGHKPFQCDRCDRSFAQKNTLVIHQRRHSDHRMYQCPHCPQTFVQKGNLLSHVAKCHTYKEGEPSFPCNQCSCTFKKIGTLNAHISKFHAAQSVLVDDDLGFKLDDVMKELNDLHRSNSLENELISKDLFFNLPVIMPPTTPEEIPNTVGDGDKQSDYANATNATQSSLKLAVHTSNGMVTHRSVMQRIHGNVRCYVCLYCPKEFRRPSDLVRHIRIHTKEKPFSCPIANCGKKFSVKSSLSKHLNTHSKSSQQHACGVCLQTFQSAETFDEHCSLTHQDNPIFQCFICSRLCVTNADLKRHLKCHRSPVKKPVRQQECEDDGIQLEIVMKEPIMLTDDGQIEVAAEKSVPDQERKFECSVCPSTFKRNGHLKEHILSHLGVKSHKCEICFKSFGKMSILNRHMLYHSNEKKFNCGTCNASFISNNQLSRHSLKHTNQRNVMCPYCQKRFKSKATCRTHLQIHKTQWMKQFKEQLKSGTIQFEEDVTLGQPNDQPALDVVTSATNERLLESLNNDNADAFHETVQRSEESNQVLFTNLVQDAQMDDSRNQFEYFLLLPSNGDPNCIATDGRSDGEQQFVVDDDQLNFANLQFIQLDQSALLELGNTATETVTSLAKHRLNDNELNRPEMVSNTDCSESQVPVPESDRPDRNDYVSMESSKEIQLANKQLTNAQRTRKSTKSINNCETCSKVFQKPIDLRRHIRTHTLEKPFSCSNCPKSFSLKSTLQNHNKNKHSDMKEMHPCTVCWKAFSSKHAVITHSLIHSNSRPFKCEYCTTTFRTRGHLKIHQQIHLREGRKLGVNPSEIKTKKEKAKLLPLINVMQEFGDPNVYEEFVDQSGFVEEMPDSTVFRVERSDTDTDNQMVNTESLTNTIYQCSLCPEQFNDKDSYSAHAASHKENLRCPDCHKVFRKPSLLKRHMIVHYGRKEFTCKICHKSYTQKATLQAHMGLHTDGASFECSQCHKKFNFKTNLTTHERQCSLLNNRTPSEYHIGIS